MNLSILKKPILVVAAMSFLGGCETFDLGDIVDVVAVADGSLGDLANLDSLDALAEMSDTEAILTGVAIAADIVTSAESIGAESVGSTPSTSKSTSQPNSSVTRSSSFDGTKYRFTCPGGYGEPNEVPMPYKNPVCVAAAKEFSEVFVCNQVSKMKAAQTAFYSKCADEIYE